MVSTVVEGDEARDEITQYEDLRSVGSSEAAWHLLAFQYPGSTLQFKLCESIQKTSSKLCSMRVQKRWH